MTAKLKNILKKESKADLYEKISEKIQEISNGDNRKKNDYYNDVIGIIKSNQEKMNKKKFPWSTTETFFRLKYFWNKLIVKQSSVMEKCNDYRVLDGLAEITGMLYPKYEFQIKEGVLGPNDPKKIEKIVDDLNSKGYYQFENKLSEEFCDRIVKSLEEVPFWSKNKTEIIKGIQLDKAKSNTYYLLKQQFATDIPEIQKLLMDPTLLNVSQEFIRCAPLITNSNIWWSVNFKKDVGELSRSAQSFHKDIEFIKFVKIFVYLSDVGSENGPHVYVPGSVQNLHLPDKYTASQRINDKFIQEKYGEGATKEFVGKKGTVIIEDTSGFHKGKPVDNGHRIILQFEFASSLYTGRIDLIHPRQIWYNKKKYSKEFKEMIKKFPRMYSQHYLN